MKNNKWAVILCGGYGRRLGRTTDTMPKSLVKVSNKPIMWYIYLMLYKNGFRNFIFPLGYKGQKIKNYIKSEFGKLGCNNYLIDTGNHTPISKRLNKVKNIIPDHEDIFMVNGDTYFDFNLLEMYDLHKKNNYLLTLSSVEIISNFGIIIEQKGKIRDFSRDRKISGFIIDSKNNTYGYINAGLVWLNMDALKFIDLDNVKGLEQNLYSTIIKKGKAGHYNIKGNWFAIDTQKDLDIINSKPKGINHIGYALKKTKKNLEKTYNLSNIQEE